MILWAAQTDDNLQPEEKPSRPGSVTKLALLVLIFAVVNLLRLIQALKSWEFLAGLLPISPAYLAISGLVWSTIGLPLVLAIWYGARWAPGLTRLTIMVYTLYYWVDRLLMPSYPGRNANWPFMAVVSVIILVWAYWVLSRINTREFFGEMHEGRREDTKIE